MIQFDLTYNIEGYFHTNTEREREGDRELE